jgi:hypothetical protein
VDDPEGDAPEKETVDPVKEGATKKKQQINRNRRTIFF